MKASLKITAAALVLGTIAATAFAGLQSNHSVSFSPSKAMAEGDLGWVHNSWFANEFIGCSANGTNGDCTAGDVAGTVKSCTTTDPALLRVIYSIQDDSFLFFSWNPDGTCKDIRVQHYSLSNPK